MDVLQPRPNLNDSERCETAPGTWSLGRGELAAWALVVVLLPALPLAFRSASTSSVEVRVARPRAASESRSAPPTLVRLDLNQATAAELDLLPGIGPARASRIVTWRSIFACRLVSQVSVDGVSVSTRPLRGREGVGHG
jgi:hypothetical protein